MPDLSFCTRQPEEKKKSGGRKDKKNLATTYSPTDEAAVPSAKRRFTVVFGMGTCGSHLSMVTRKTVKRLERKLKTETVCFGIETIIWSSLTAY